jgi:elongation factor P
MVLAAQLRQGMVTVFEGQTYRVLGSEHHPGPGKMGGVNLGTGTLRDYSFRSELKLQEAAVGRHTDGGHGCWMNPDTFEQTETAGGTLRPRARLLFAGMRLAVELPDGRPMNVVFPDVLELRVTDTAPSIPEQAVRNFKTAKLENGIEVLVPRFVKTGDVIRLHVETFEYMARADARASTT